MLGLTTSWLYTFTIATMPSVSLNLRRRRPSAQFAILFSLSCELNNYFAHLKAPDDDDGGLLIEIPDKSGLLCGSGIEL